jgi:hypothetical protein
VTAQQEGIFIWIKPATAELSTYNNSQPSIMIGLRSLLILLVALCASFKMTAAQALPVDIGKVSELNGNAQIIRDDAYGVTMAFPVQQMDDVRTAAGRVGITFVDDSVVRLTEHSKLVITEYIFNPDPDKSKLSLRFASGTARFITSKMGLINKERINITTPTAQIAIRGTDFTCTVDELGRSLIILLPDANGDASGEIMVATGAGTVTLNKPYQATTASVYESVPTRPVQLDITLDLIDNMLIVSPPKEEEIAAEEAAKASNVLDFDALEFDDLDVDYLDAEAELAFEELDINFLDVNFLEDLLDIVEDLDALSDDEIDQVETSIAISGTSVGQDPTTQITTIIQGQQISLRRNVSENVRVDIDGSGSYTVIFIQDGVSKTITINGGGSSVIKIKQG